METKTIIRATEFTPQDRALYDEREKLASDLCAKAAALRQTNENFLMFLAGPIPEPKEYAPRTVYETDLTSDRKHVLLIQRKNLFL